MSFRGAAKNIRTVGYIVSSNALGLHFVIWTLSNQSITEIRIQQICP